MAISQREAQIYLWPFMTSLMIIFDPKKKVIHDKIIFVSFMSHYWNLWPFPARSAKPFMTIYDFIDDHFWLKKARSAKPISHWYHFWQERTIQVKNSWVILNPGQKGFRGSRSQCPTINALGYRLCKSPNNQFRALFCSKVRVSWGDLPSAASPPTYATPIECALWYLQCAPTIASGLPLSIVPSVGIT